MIKFKDVANLYLGCEVIFNKEIHYFNGLSIPYKTNDKTIPSFSVRPDKSGFRSTIHSLENFNLIVPMLRPLSDMKEDEEKVIDAIWEEMSEDNHTANVEVYAAITKKCIEFGFDLFDLIENGEAVDINQVK